MTIDPSASAGAPDLSAKALDLLRAGIFPDAWTFVPVAGKATYIENWTTKPLSRQACIDAYKLRSDYNGLGVVTGSFSEGLIALDIDGPLADERYREAAGDGYEPYGAESSMSWTSGKEGRRQILYVVPDALLSQLAHVNKLILRVEDGDWHLGQGDSNRSPGQKPGDAIEEPYEEVVLRFNHCQSVVPGSVHPELKTRYKWLNYNNGEVAMAPRWIVDVLCGVAKARPFLSESEQKQLEAEFGETSIPSPQIRGWFFKDDVQRLLMPRLEELVFKHEVFDQYGWDTRSGQNPQRLSGCPWHGGRSGSTFQYSVNSGVWYCHSCNVGGDVLQFVHKIRTNDKKAGNPTGPDLEVYVAEIAKELGFEYPECAKAVHVTTKDAPLRRLTGHEFFKAVQEIDDSFENAELGDYHLMELVRDAGLMNVYRSGPQVRGALERFILHEQQVEDAPRWQEECRGQRDYLIPDFMSKPSSVMLHARGGMGKTRLAVLISKIVGQQLPMKVRGLTVTPSTSGNVLFIGNDMSMTDYAEYLDQQGIDSAGRDTWFKFKPQWQQSQYKVLVRWLEEYKPVLVVVDSLTSVSTMIAAKEYEKEYANTLYRLARENGTAFPATTFLWIHHNTKDGTKFRGTDTLRNAVHETWELKELSDEERVQFGDNALILEIDKSRGMRGGDRFLVREDIEEVLSLEDLTPTVKRANNGQGDETPRTLVLGILKEAGEAGLTVKELRYELNGRLTGRRGQGTHVSRRTAERWLHHWVATGLVETVEVRPAGQKGGRPSTGFRAVSPICLGKDDQNPLDLPENDCSAGEEVLVTQMTKTPQGDESDQNLGGVSSEPGETGAQLAGACEGVTLPSPDLDAGGARPVLVIEVEKTGVTKTSPLETPSSTAIPEDEAEVLVTEPQVKEIWTPVFEVENWDAADWG